ncbi:hypothetical protein CHLNCDRAFT_141758 [Chlorella variabilis]|uniref:C2 domain-containing protein n=1 Tax=Chlorella variabilis TaxID=554065 RepID=E1ZTJ1_CHLVA|nr:hypothetical protein CHLNCDRAFT_141758 [Chlorella variabilis]EFN50817.1 hypothetical protein CHLNCDRAFT_141758 [Chlorella variabilis]|eukprot:XP_005842919.1 hypothetical protein CHLNCDRAFT_141758 [Chlorella variabilis]
MHESRRGVAATAAAEGAAAAPATADDDPSTAFDWSLGLALAGCAFEAYNDIEAGAPSLKMTSMGGTEITYVDKDFLRRKFAGLMEVTAVKAAGLPAADWWPGSKSDPYAVLNIGDSAAATAVVQQSLEPQWGETFFLDPAKQRLTVRVLDADVGKSDDLLGSTMRGLQDVVDGAAHDVELPLRGGSGSAGSITLRLRFLAFGQDDVLAGEAAASHMGDPVLGSPPSTILSSQWRSLQRDVLNAAADAMFDPVAYLDNPETDTQVWIFWNPATRRVCVAFRGTEQTKWKDILTDLSLVPASLDPEGVPDPSQQAWRRRDAAGQAASPAPTLEAAVSTLQSKRQDFRSSVLQGLRTVLQQQQQEQGTAAAEQGGGEDQAPLWVHHGFLDAYASVRSEVLRLLETVLAGETEPWTLYVTGHSLGGALSTLCAYDCARRTWRGVPRPAIVHYNYGSPRVGNKAFAEQFDALVPNTWRVANSNDAVALVPRMLGYCHVGHRALLGPDGQVELTRNSSQSLGEGAEMADVALAAAVNLPMLTEQLLAKQEEAAVASGDEQSIATADMLQQSKPVLVSAATAVAAAASALAGTGQQQDGEAQPGSKAAAAAAVVSSAAATAAAVAAAPSVRDVASLLEEEIRAMSALLDGSALSDHLEPLYLENLSAAIAKLQELKEA